MRRSLSIATLVCLCMVTLIQLAEGKGKLIVSKVDVIKDIRSGITRGQEKHPDAGYCGKFKMSERQVRTFFKKAEIISSRQRHDEYNWSPCYVEGTLVQKGKVHSWKIFGSKVGEAEYSSGEKVFLGCKKCGKPFFDF